MYVTLGQAGSFDGIAKTTDRGESWRVLRGNGLPPANPGGGGDIYALPDRPDEVWAVLAGSLYRSIDGGEHWRVAHGGPGLRSIAAVPGRPRTFYVSGARGGYRTDDGETFDLVPGSPTDAQRLAVAGSEPTCLFVIARGELWRLLNGSWTGFRHDPQMAGLAADPSDPDRIAIATDDEPYHDVSRASGVWITEDGGKTWTQENQGLPCLRGSVLAFNPHDPEQLIFGTDGRGFFVTRWPRRAR